MTMTRRLSGLLFVPALALSLAACQSTPASSDSTSSADKPSAGAAQREITGTATYLERIKMPPGASLHVQLIDNHMADTQKAVVSEITMKDVAGPPYNFTLPYDPNKLRDVGVYTLNATLYGPDGQLWFATRERVPFDPMDGTPIELRMQRVAAP